MYSPSAALDLLRNAFACHNATNCCCKFAKTCSCSFPVQSSKRSPKQSPFASMEASWKKSLVFSVLDAFFFSCHCKWKRANKVHSCKSWLNAEKTWIRIHVRCNMTTITPSSSMRAKIWFPHQRKIELMTPESMLFMMATVLGSASSSMQLSSWPRQTWKSENRSSMDDARSAIEVLSFWISASPASMSWLPCVLRFFTAASTWRCLILVSHNFWSE